MKIGAIVSVVVAIGAAVGIGAVFMNNASPYATIAEARKLTEGKDIHVVGKLAPGTLSRQLDSGDLRFALNDETGAMNVVYRGSTVSSLESATQIVVIGSFKGEVFEAHDMLVKCPSKYESSKA